MDKPRPVPFPTSLVVKNGSKMRRSKPGGIPCPVSTNATSSTATPTEAEMRITFRGESSTASRALVSRLMNTCSSWMGLPTTMGSSGPSSSVTSISCRRSCSCTSDRARSITGPRAIGSRVTGAARPNVRRCVMICVALRTCSMAWRSSRRICPLSVTPRSIMSMALATKRAVLLSGLFSSWATPVVSSPSVASVSTCVRSRLSVVALAPGGVPSGARSAVTVSGIAFTVSRLALRLLAQPLQLFFERDHLELATHHHLLELLQIQDLLLQLGLGFLQVSHDLLVGPHVAQDADGADHLAVGVAQGRGVEH